MVSGGWGAVGDPLDAALGYAARGWRVLPLHWPTSAETCSCQELAGAKTCTHIGKHPLTRNGVRAATTDEARIRAWWKRFPRANVAIATGAGPRGGLVVLDVDPRHLGDESLDLLTDVHGRLPDTVQSCTGGGGLHYLFAYDPVAVGRVPCSQGKLGVGVDVCGDDGYIVAPPSVHQCGRTYGWELASEPDDVTLAEVPAWLLALARGAARVEGARGRRGGGRLDGEDAIPEGQRNTELVRVAGSLRARGLDRAELGASLAEVNRLRCVPPLDAREVAEIAESVCRYPAGLSPEYEARAKETEGRAVQAERTGGRYDHKADPAWWASQGTPSAAPRGAGGVPVVPSAPSSARVEEEEEGDWEGLLARNKRAVSNTFRNVCLIFRHDPAFKGRLRYNAMSLYPEFDGAQLRDADTGRFREDIEREHGFSPGVESLEMALRVVSEERSYHPVREYLAGLEWDGVPRIAGLLRDVLGATDTSSGLLGRALRYFFVSAVARAFDPGCKVDLVLILKGPQGARKSSFLSALAGAWFSDSHMDITSRDGKLQVHSAWIHEWPEIEAIFRRSHNDDMKGFIASATDNFRKPYGRNNEFVRRSSIFAGTTNQEVFLTDPTGNRRFVVIEVTGEIPIEQVRAMRDQLWAEAVAAYQDGERFYFDKAEESEKEGLLEQYQQTDPWEHEVTLHLVRTRAASVIINDVLTGALKLEKKDLSDFAQKRVGAILRRLGWKRGRGRPESTVGTGPLARTVKGPPTWMYFPPPRWFEDPDRFEQPTWDDPTAHAPAEVPTHLREFPEVEGALPELDPADLPM